MRNVDKIRTLKNQNELLKRQVEKLREENTLLTTANLQIRQMIDAVLIEIAKEYGEEREEDGKLWGFRFVTHKVDVKANLENWEIKVEDQGEDRVIGIFPREKQETEGDNGQV